MVENGISATGDLAQHLKRTACVDGRTAGVARVAVRQSRQGCTLETFFTFRVVQRRREHRNHIEPVSKITLVLGRQKMLLIIGIVLLVLWLLGFLAFHVTSGLIHLLLVFAVISIIWHLVTGRRATV